jgi:hypothetical protein
MALTPGACDCVRTRALEHKRASGLPVRTEDRKRAKRIQQRQNVEPTAPERRRNNACRNPKFPPEKSCHVRALCRWSRTTAVQTPRRRLKMSINVGSLCANDRALSTFIVFVARKTWMAGIKPAMTIRLF